MGDDFVSVKHILLTFHSDKRFRKKLFKNPKLTEEDLMNAIKAVRCNQRVTDPYPKGKYEYLKKYGTDLTMLADHGKFDHVIDRVSEIERCMHILTRKTKNNPVLIGEPGVGKTAIAEGLAQLIGGGDVLESLQNRKLISLNMGSLVAGAKHRGDFEKRLEAILKEVVASNGHIVLFFDEIHTVVRVGSSSGAMDARNLLKLMFGQGEFWVIMATTMKEYKRYIEKDPALERRFEHVRCNQPSIAETISILHEQRDGFKQHHDVEITDGALVSTTVLADQYIEGVNLEMEAVEREYDLKHATELKYGTSMPLQCQPEEAQKKLTDFLKFGLSLIQKEVTEADITEILSRSTDILLSNLQQPDHYELARLEEILHKRVVGQDTTIKSVVDAIICSKFGLFDKNRLIAIYIYVCGSGGCWQD
ncbi:hypothetical protein Ddye_005874 [Dipteronia dyeriana]|uniref:Clp R domain-containing protein n=1 Tax=Dipteronia dyeriana TaxID=168575 RepID=A0AAD9XGX8_9ROSI|nr:hypothetical protein Ddye_005874 [Dipteronia dyeriana]